MENTKGTMEYKIGQYFVDHRGVLYKLAGISKNPERKWADRYNLIEKGNADAPISIDRIMLERLFVPYNACKHAKYGDVLVSNNGDNLTVVFGSNDTLYNGVFNAIASTYGDNDNVTITHDFIENKWDGIAFRPATILEISTFWEKLRKLGLYWNDETNRIESVKFEKKGKEDNDACDNTRKDEYKYSKDNFKPFDKVIVRGFNNIWHCAIFSHLTKDGHDFVTTDSVYKECVPYNDETAHLIGTHDDYEGTYKAY